MGHDCVKQADFGADFGAKCLGETVPKYRMQKCLRYSSIIQKRIATICNNS